MSAKPLVSWRRETPQTHDEIVAARLLRAIGPAPSLSPEAVDRVARHVRTAGRTAMSKTALLRSPRLSFDAKVMLISTAFAAVGIVVALVCVMLESPPDERQMIDRVDRVCAPGFPPGMPANAVPALEEDALFARGECRLRLGYGEGASTDLRAYLARFPTGRFAPRAGQLLRSAHIR